MVQRVIEGRHPDSQPNSDLDICVICGTSFVKWNIRRIYCSAACRNKAKARRNTERYRSDKDYRRRVLDWSKAKYHSDPEFRAKKTYKYIKPWISRNPWCHLLTTARHRASAAGLPCSLTRQWARDRWTGRCELTNIPFNLAPGRKTGPLSPSIDRIVPALGYTPTNCRFVLHAINALKSTGTDEDMYRLARALLERETGTTLSRTS